MLSFARAFRVFTGASLKVMKKVKIINLSNNSVVLEQAEVADTFFLRLKGLLGRSGLPPGKGILIKPCRAVHTLGMSFSIDVAFVDNNNCICYLIEDMSPCKLSPAVKGSAYVIEGPAGTFKQSGTALGDEVSWKAIDC